MPGDENSQNSLVILVIGIVLVLVVVGLVLLGNPASVSTSASLKKVAATDFATEIKQQESVILDIRTAQEFSSGRIEGAVNIDYYSSDFRSQLNKLDKNASYKIYCNSGNRSGSALEIMRGLGFTNVVELAGGIQAWSRNNLPVCTNC